MSSWFGRWFAYGLGKAAGKVIFGDERDERRGPREPIRNQTEAEILADEKRFDEDAKRIEAQAAAARKSAKQRP